MEKYYREHEMKDFLKTKVIKNRKNEISCSEAYEKYKKWCYESNTLPNRRITFINFLVSKGFEIVKKETEPFYFKGMKIKK